MRVIQVMDGVPISARTQSRGSREHSAEIWSIVQPINYESYTAMRKAYLHARKCNCTSFLFTSARSSPKRRLTGALIANTLPYVPQDKLPYPSPVQGGDDAPPVRFS